MDEDLSLVRGSGNVFRDLGRPGADQEQAKALLASEIIRMLDRHGPDIRLSAELTRIRNADLRHFTVESLEEIAARLRERVE